MRYLSKLSKEEFSMAAAKAAKSSLIPVLPLTPELLDELGGKTAVWAHNYLENARDYFGDRLDNYLAECKSLTDTINNATVDVDDKPHAVIAALRIADGALSAPLLRQLVISNDSIPAFLELLSLHYLNSAALAFKIMLIPLGIKYLHEASEARRLIDIVRNPNGKNLDWKQFQAELISANAARNGEKGRAKREAKRDKLRNWAIEKYIEKKWAKAGEAAYELTPAIMAQAKILGVGLSPSNAQRTITEWFKKHDMQSADTPGRQM